MPVAVAVAIAVPAAVAVAVPLAVVTVAVAVALFLALPNSLIPLFGVLLAFVLASAAALVLRVPPT